MLAGFPDLIVAVPVFVGAAALVWIAGTRLPSYVVALSEKTGLGHGFAGLLVLGSITSLPELATATSASAMGTPLIALNNILGSASFNILLLAFADLIIGKRPLTSVVARPVVQVQGVLGMLLLVVVTAAIVAGAGGWPGFVGPWSSGILVLCIGALAIASRAERRPMWLVVDPVVPDLAEASAPAAIAWRKLIAVIAALAAVILLGGLLLAWSADIIARDSGLGQQPVGFLFVAAATSLPELSGIVGAMRQRHYELAVGEIFGSNLFNIAIIFVIDLASPGGPVLALAGNFEAMAALLAMALTGIYVLALIERRDRLFLRMGEGSLAAIAVYLAGAAYLFAVRTM
ncbi:sodium:calcium antiporter [Croceicoccus mobilis]|uniref:Sodium/calcium exchanger membrane region domain-containing protein n=1 Tax=Croceicoccus mobilis TaxID=1703339 RepID=A0A917DVR7_9SPHN|nr:hypothetical protein [Croceicoccus mobilis]GGD75829.1 hypothetical protein GCM10010990_26790 [Croceicoccus mobilis]